MLMPLWAYSCKRPWMESYTFALIHQIWGKGGGHESYFCSTNSFIVASSSSHNYSVVYNILKVQINSFWIKCSGPEDLITWRHVVACKTRNSCGSRLIHASEMKLIVAHNRLPSLLLQTTECWKRKLAERDKKENYIL